jgi:hypothetical protein
MARKPTHYRMTVNRPLEVMNARFRPGARYTVKAAVHDAIKDQASDAIATAEPMMME